MTQIQKPPLRVLLELRPALGGHAGIPQATRLLFRSLAVLDEVHIEGLLQTHERVLSAGLPSRGMGRFGELSTDQQLNRLGRVVIAIEQGRTWASHVHTTALTIMMAAKHLLGGSQKLTRFDARHFQDFVWRKFFARTLPPEDFEFVMRAAFRIARIPWNAMHICGLVTRKMGYPLYPRLDTSDFDVMIAETPYPAAVSKNTRLVIRYHDAIPLLMPHTIVDRRFHQAFHYRALRKNVESGAWFVCVSDATRRDLLSVFPQAEERSVTIHNMVSHHYNDEPSDAKRIPEIVRTRINTEFKAHVDSTIARKLLKEAANAETFDYLLIVSTIEPRKNHLTLLSAWEKLRVECFPNLKMLIVGSLGWHHAQIVRKFQSWLERGEAFLLEDVRAEELRVLYSHARATVCPSFGEGFDFSGVEAMKCGSPVVASDISVHREVYADAAEFFNPYSVDSLSHAIQSVIDPSHHGRRQDLVARGAVVAQSYSQDSIMPKWQSFLQLQTSGDLASATSRRSIAWT
jgi:glycosyltransferase involved in cell wall biosynthesis